MHTRSQSQIAVSLESSRNDLSNEGKHAMLGLVGAAWRHTEDRESGCFLALCGSAMHLTRAMEASKIFIFYLIAAQKFMKLRSASLLVPNSETGNLRKHVFWQKIGVLRPCSPLRVSWPLVTLLSVPERGLCAVSEGDAPHIFHHEYKCVAGPEINF